MSDLSPTLGLVLGLVTLAALVGLSLAVGAWRSARATSLDLQQEVTRLKRARHQARRKAKRAEHRALELQAAAPVLPPLDGSDLASPAQALVAQLTFDGDQPHVVLLMQSLSPHFVFAGIRTALVAAAEVADQSGLPLRILVCEASTETPEETLASVRRVLSEMGYAGVAAGLRLSLEDARENSGHTSNDIWVATLWTTAFALLEPVRLGLIHPDRVIYLIQDWEPGFYGWGDLHLRAEQTYRAGYRHLVNSMSLARYLADSTDTVLNPAAVFAPEVDAGQLATAATRWTPGRDDEVRVLFYARPATPRNMFNLGMQSLRRWADEYAEVGVRPVVRFAGQAMRPVDLGPAIDVEVLGKTSYDEYYAQLAKADLGLALMYSAHPGHLALELPMAGIPTVTNTFGDFRSSWVDGLITAEPDVGSLAHALAEAREQGRGRTTHTAALELRDLGGSLVDAVRAVARGLV